MTEGAVQTTSGGTATARASAPHSLVGTVLEGSYSITGLIAQGGMSAVYEALQLRLKQRVAVKVLARELASNPEALARFHREAEITSRLRHPHLVTVTDFGTAPEGQPYLVMEYLQGIDLDQRIRQSGRLPLTAVVHIAKQVSSALAAAHEKGIVHRDLKPANVFLVELPGEPDFAKILDFGISKVRAATTQLTKASSIIGTPNYMAPEQATGLLDEIDQRTDQWALACIVWEMLTGRPPFASDDVSAVFYQVIHLEPQPLGRRSPDTPPEVEAVLRRALAKTMADRFPSIRDFATALVAAAEDGAHPLSSRPARQVASADGAPGIPSQERRRARQERRRTDVAGAVMATMPESVSGWRKLRPAHAVLFLGAVLVLAALGPLRRSQATKEIVTPTDAPTTTFPRIGTPPSVVIAPATPPPSHPVAAMKQVVKSARQRAASVEDTDPFEALGRRPAAPGRAGRDRGSASAFVDPFGP